MSARIALVLLAALATGCPTVDLGDDLPDPGQCRPDPAYFESMIWPEFLAPADPERTCVGEAGCHRRDDGRSAFRLEVPPPDQPELVDHAANYAVVTRFLNCGTPDASSLYTKPLTGVDAHGGGDLFDDQSMAATVFLQWFEQ